MTKRNPLQDHIVDILCDVWPEGPEGIAQRIIAEVITTPKTTVALEALLPDAAVEEVYRAEDGELSELVIYTGLADDGNGRLVRYADAAEIAEAARDDYAEKRRDAAEGR